jgi:hypothetical protein
VHARCVWGLNTSLWSSFATSPSAKRWNECNLSSSQR